ncbi:LacI family DNA-binding transcriptional regulator [Actinosynnema mirum]|uniref:Transcriptional regulator, LacI family n=2 Tax=Actinosynnema TaxID=40566 RepID=C6W892_ACTMD|nr:LacI family DNA-binding transcriptional regulator [Actinosynnema mirum]ACU38939.1 transcriptional regulator, LacI family [Actinosynnema mirum DSM 43827]AXX32532.1 Transcriptional regulator [Actinosynnema pretiosum subsp. pretiosum]
MTSMSDVAKAAGVSAATVSRALRGEPGVSESTREHVAEVAKRMRYAIARDASSLAGGRRYAVAVLTADVGLGDLLAGAESALREAGYDVLLYVLNDPAARARFFDQVPTGRRVDGVLALAIRPTEAERAALDGAGVPVVLVEDGDLGEAVALAARHLIGHGHREVALVLAEDVDESLDGVLAAEGLVVRPEWTVWSSPTVAGGEQVVDALLDGGALPTAVISSSGEMALGAYLRLRRDGREDVSVVSLEGAELARAVGITAVEGAWRERGEHATAALLSALRGDAQPHPEALAPPSAQLVVRGSSGPAPRSGANPTTVAP